MKIVHKVQTKNKNKRKKNETKATCSTINDSSEAENVLSSENLRTDEPSRMFMITVCAVAQHCYNGDVSFLWEKWKL